MAIYRWPDSSPGRYTGLSEDYWDKANLRIDEGRFTKELLRNKGETVGRVDLRFKGDMINLLGESAFYDPMTTAIGPPYLAAFMDRSMKKNPGMKVLYQQGYFDLAEFIRDSYDK
jgi:hypothetical protein